LQQQPEPRHFAHFWKSGKRKAPAEKTGCSSAAAMPPPIFSTGRTGSHAEKGLADTPRPSFLTRSARKSPFQQRMLEHGKTLFDWLEQGAFFYVCGDARRMAGDVDQALHEIIVRHGRRSGNEPADYVNRIKRERRYVRDVY
jgi:hypothetical protein